jgi:hypothetical protein
MSEVHIVQTFRVPTYHNRADKSVCALFSPGYQYILTSSFSVPVSQIRTTRLELVFQVAQHQPQSFSWASLASLFSTPSKKPTALARLTASLYFFPASARFPFISANSPRL